MSGGEERACVRQKRSIYRVHYALKKPAEEGGAARPHASVTRPASSVAPAAAVDPAVLEIHKYKEQVAGHQATHLDRYLGILQCNNGTILKPILKEGQRRETEFYETLDKRSDKRLLELREYVPQYHGCRSFRYNGHEGEYLILQDLTAGMLEPSVMDAKLGRRTWDPRATDEKVAAEKRKYAACKREVAFCVPGFQVYKLATGKLHKYNKDYGKRLNGSTVRDALRTFLNASGGRLCRTLVLQFLTELWKIQKWASKQTAVKLYSTSLLLVYDTQRLRSCCGGASEEYNRVKSSCAASPVVRKVSTQSMLAEVTGSNFSGQLSPSGPIYSQIKPPPTTPMALAQSSFAPHHLALPPRHQDLSPLHRSHSFHHNYDDEMSKIKINYRALLDQLSSDSRPKPWVAVKVIDFVHAYFSDEGEESVDCNFSEGLDNVVKIFEEFLGSTEEF